MTIYENITQRILNQLAAGVVPWRKTWKTGLPRSLSTGRDYRGINVLVLGSTEYTSRYWLTYRQAHEKGGHVRKGERATPVVYWKWRTPEERRRAEEQTGREAAPCVPFVSAVFNLEQIEGIARPADDLAPTGHRLDIAARMLEVMPDKPEIIHTLTSQPAYSPRLDRVTMPHLSQFESADEYYNTLFHELTHSSGAAHRLNRFAEVEGDRFERYSFEELVAEFGAAFLCGFTGIENRGTEALAASYIEGWSRVFKQDNRVLLRAASAAQRATDYIRGKLPATEPVDAQPQAAAEPVAALA